MSQKNHTKLVQAEKRRKMPFKKEIFIQLMFNLKICLCQKSEMNGTLNPKKKNY